MVPFELTEDEAAVLAILLDKTLRLAVPKAEQCSCRKPSWSENTCQSEERLSAIRHTAAEERALLEEVASRLAKFVTVPGAQRQANLCAQCGWAVRRTRDGWEHIGRRLRHAPVVSAEVA